MKIRVYPNKPAEYVPDILFKDGTYKNRKDYVARMRKLDERLSKKKK